MTLHVFCCDMATPDDVTAITHTLASCRHMHTIAILVRCAGHAGPDDWSRRLARHAIMPVLERLGLAERCVLMLSAGCEGIATPCCFIVAEDGMTTPGGPERATLLTGRACMLAPDDEDALAASLEVLVQDTLQAGTLRPDQVVVAMVRVPAGMGAPGGAHARARRAIAALAVGRALGDFGACPPDLDMIRKNEGLFARRIMSFAGADQKEAELLIIGQKPEAGGNLVAAVAQLSSLTDARALRHMLRGAGVDFDAQGDPIAPHRIALLSIKGGAAPGGRVLGAPTTLLSSSIPPDAHIRAALSGFVGAIAQTTRFHISADPARQAIPGGAVACCLVRTET